MVDSLKITSKTQLKYCPRCGEPTTTEEVPVGGVEIDGEMRTTKTNLKVKCPEHGELYVG